MICFAIAEPLDKGKVNAMFTWGTRLEKNETYDLCYLLAKVNHTCPVHPGMYIAVVFVLSDLASKHHSGSDCYYNNA